MNGVGSVRLHEFVSRRRWKWRLAVVTMLLGLGVGALGLRVMVQGEGERMGGWLVGYALVALLTGGVSGWRNRPGQSPEALLAAEGSRKDRLQRDRTLKLVALAAVLPLILINTVQGASDFIAGGRGVVDGGRVLLPVLYGWVIPMILMGWDVESRKNRKYLDDELTRSMRAQAVVWGFVVLMAGATAALLVGLMDPVVAVLILPFVIGLSGAAAGLRFAWLDWSAGRDG